MSTQYKETIKIVIRWVRLIVTLWAIGLLANFVLSLSASYGKSYHAYSWWVQSLWNLGIGLAVYTLYTGSTDHKNLK